MQEVNDRLRSADAERRDDQPSPAPGGAAHHLAEALGRLLDRLVRVPAISTLTDEQLGGWHRSGGTEDGDAGPAEVAGEGQPALAAWRVDLQVDHRRAEQVAGLDEGRLDAPAHLRGRVVGDGAQAQQGAVDV